MGIYTGWTVCQASGYRLGERWVMRKLFLGLMLLVPSVAQGQSWSTVAEKLKESVVFLENSHGTCTAFVIDQPKNLVLTAAHCYDELPRLYVDNKPVTKVVSRDTKKDLLVLSVDGLDRPALTLAKNDPTTGDEVASRGFGYGLEEPFFRVHHVSAHNLDIDYQNIGGPLIAVDTTYVGGMSGGPLVNLEGHVVGIVQLGTESVGFGVGAETIRDKAGKYFESK